MKEATRGRARETESRAAATRDLPVLLREPRILLRGSERPERLDDFAAAVRAGLRDRKSVV